MGNAASSSSSAAGPTLADYDLPSYAPAAVATRQDQDVFEQRLEALLRAHLSQVQQQLQRAFGAAAAHEDVDWAQEAPLSAVPRELAERVVECLRGSTLGELAALFAVPLNAQMLPDKQSLSVVRHNVLALHPDRRRARSADLYEAATVAYEQLSQLVMLQADMFAGLVDKDTSYHVDDRVVLPASMRPPPPQQQQEQLSPDGGGDMDVEGAAAAADDRPAGTDAAAAAAADADPVTAEERETIRSIMRWAEDYAPSEAEMRELRARVRAGKLALQPLATSAGGFAVAVFDAEARARALGMYDRDAIRACTVSALEGQGAITASALVIAPVAAQPRFFQGLRIADRQLVFAGDGARGGTVQGLGGGALTVGGGGGGVGCGVLVGSSLAEAYRKRPEWDLEDQVPARHADNSDVAAAYEQRMALYDQRAVQKVPVCSTKLQLPVIYGSAHNEARGDVAAARGRGIGSLRPRGRAQKQGAGTDADDAGARRRRGRDDDDDNNDKNDKKDDPAAAAQLTAAAAAAAAAANEVAMANAAEALAFAAAAVAPMNFDQE